MISQVETSSLECGCVIGYFACPKLQRLEALEKDAYWHQDWEAYEEFNRQVWHHMGMKSPFYE